MRRTALVTGGSRGIGLGIARALVQKGFNLAICGLREESAVCEIIESLRAMGGNVLYVRADVADAAQRNRLLEMIRGEFGQLNILVNNAGVAPQNRADMLEATEESFERLMRINLQGPYFLTQQAAKWMITERGADPSFEAAIINISSISATVASPNRGDYCVSKAGISMATKLWAVRLGEFGIPVYEVRPGIIETDMTAGVRDKYDQLIAEGLLVEPRWGTPADIGRAVAMLANGDLPYATGQVLLLDGGLTLERL
ncbi:MAG: 3-ketoacyl-ACP reductase [Anaerolineaceae bacterium]|nr:3-ketoacyl-ACP reductase [Anaerolineaceae bacterium]